MEATDMKDATLVSSLSTEQAREILLDGLQKALLEHHQSTFSRADDDDFGGGVRKGKHYFITNLLRYHLFREKRTFKNFVLAVVLFVIFTIHQALSLPNSAPWTFAFQSFVLILVAFGNLWLKVARQLRKRYVLERKVRKALDEYREEMQSFQPDEGNMDTFKPLLLKPSVSTVPTFRDGKWRNTPTNLIVKGDLVALTDGEAAPANCHMLCSVGMSVDGRMSPVLDLDAATLSGDDVSRFTFKKGEKINYDLGRSGGVSNNDTASEGSSSTVGFGDQTTCADDDNNKAEPSIILSVCGDMSCFLVEETPAVETVKDAMKESQKPEPLIETQFFAVIAPIEKIGVAFVAVSLAINLVRSFLVLGGDVNWLDMLVTKQVQMMFCFLPLSMPGLLALSEAMGEAQLLSVLQSDNEEKAPKPLLSATEESVHDSVATSPLDVGGHRVSGTASSPSTPLASSHDSMGGGGRLGDNASEGQTVPLTSHIGIDVSDAAADALLYQHGCCAPKGGGSFCTRVHAKVHTLGNLMTVRGREVAQFTRYFMFSLLAEVRFHSTETEEELQIGGSKEHDPLQALLSTGFGSATLLHTLGAVTRICCIDDEVLCDPFPSVEEIFLPKVSESNSRNGTILDLHPAADAEKAMVPGTSSRAGGTEVRFDDPSWKNHMKQLKPIGLCCMLNNPRKRRLNQFKKVDFLGSDDETATRMSLDIPYQNAGGMQTLSGAMTLLADHVRRVPPPQVHSIKPLPLHIRTRSVQY
jgi:hypothetical protein